MSGGETDQDFCNQCYDEAEAICCCCHIPYPSLARYFPDNESPRCNRCTRSLETQKRKRQEEKAARKKLGMISCCADTRLKPSELQEIDEYMRKMSAKRPTQLSLHHAEMEEEEEQEKTLPEPPPSSPVQVVISDSEDAAPEGEEGLVPGKKSNFPETEHQPTMTYDDEDEADDDDEVKPEAHEDSPPAPASSPPSKQKRGKNSTGTKRLKADKQDIYDRVAPYFQAPKQQRAAQQEEVPAVAPKQQQQRRRKPAVSDAVNNPDPDHPPIKQPRQSRSRGGGSTAASKTKSAGGNILDEISQQAREYGGDYSARFGEFLLCHSLPQFVFFHRGPRQEFF